MYMQDHGLARCCYTCVDFEASSPKAKGGMCHYYKEKTHMINSCKCYSENQDRVNRILAGLEGRWG